MITKSDVLDLLSRWEAQIEELERFNAEAPEKHKDLSEIELALNEAHRKGEMKAYRMAIKRLKAKASGRE
jgi:trehalose-6-phosphate synthase